MPASSEVIDLLSRALALNLMLNAELLSKVFLVQTHLSVAVND